MGLSNVIQSTMHGQWYRYYCLDLVSNWLKKDNCLLITIWKLSSFKVDNQINFFFII